MIETGKSISEWASDTFGPSTSQFRTAVRAAQEACELVSMVSCRSSSWTWLGLVEECADVAIVVARLCWELDADAVEWCRPKGRPHGSIQSLALDVYTRVGMLMRSVLESDEREQLWHAHMVFRSLVAICEVARLDLSEEIDAKMAINRGRRWVLDNTGHGQHE